MLKPMNCKALSPDELLNNCILVRLQAREKERGGVYVIEIISDGTISLYFYLPETPRTWIADYATLQDLADDLNK